MPFQNETYQRYRPAIAFAAVVVTFALGLAALKVAVNRTDRAAHQARALAARVDRQQHLLAAEAARRLDLRNRQIRVLKEVDARSCTSRHLIDHAVQVILSRSIAQAKSAPPFPGLTPAQQAELDRRTAQGLAVLEAGVANLKKADCVPPPTPKVPTG